MLLSCTVQQRQKPALTLPRRQVTGDRSPFTLSHVGLYFHPVLDVSFFYIFDFSAASGFCFFVFFSSFNITVSNVASVKKQQEIKVSDQLYFSFFPLPSVNFLSSFFIFFIFFIFPSLSL